MSALATVISTSILADGQIKRSTIGVPEVYVDTISPMGSLHDIPSDLESPPKLVCASEQCERVKPQDQITVKFSSCKCYRSIIHLTVTDTLTTH